MEEVITAEELNRVLYALALMYNQYCGDKGHLFMSAGEYAMGILEHYDLLNADIAGRGIISYKTYKNLLTANKSEK